MSDRVTDERIAEIRATFIERVARYLCKLARHDPDGPISYCRQGPRWTAFQQEAEKWLSTKACEILIHDIAEKQTALDAATARLREAEGLIAELIPEAEANAEAQYPTVSHGYPSIKAKYDAEMELPNRARTFLKGAANG